MGTIPRDIDTARLRQRAGWHSPLAFLRGRETALAEMFLDDLAEATATGATVRSEYRDLTLWYSFLAWDSDYFALPSYRLDFAAWPETTAAPTEALARALAEQLDALGRRHPEYYLFAEVPAEDLNLLQALGTAGLRLIETRLTYYRDDLRHFDWPRRSRVRPATEADIPGLRQTAAAMRNGFDRFHADPCFTADQADAYLATFVENSVRGFADLVMVPADGERPDAFLTAKRLPRESARLGCHLGRMVLSAVGASRSGWYLRLIAEMSHWLRQEGIETAFLTTQASNRAVIRVWEKLGYRYGRCTHILARAKRMEHR